MDSILIPFGAAGPLLPDFSHVSYFDRASETKGLSRNHPSPSRYSQENYLSDQETELTKADSIPYLAQMEPKIQTEVQERVQT